MTAAYARVGNQWQRVAGSNLTLGTAFNQAARGDHTHPIADTGWVEASSLLVNGWVNYGSTWETCAYRRVNGVVYLRGLIRSGTTSSGGGGIPYRFFTLPVGFRPGGASHTPIVSNGAWAIINIHPTGEVAPNTNCNNGWLSLANVSFPADQ